jgi:hypothetical protein
MRGLRSQRAAHAAAAARGQNEHCCDERRTGSGAKEMADPSACGQNTLMPALDAWNVSP